MGDEGAGLGFLEQPLLAWTAIAANAGAVGRGSNGNRNLGPKKVLSGLVIMLILLKIFGELGFLPSRKEKRAVNSWATMSFHQLSFKKYDDILQCLEGSLEQHPRVVVLGSVDRGNGGAEGVLRENWSSQDLMSFESKGGGNCRSFQRDRICCYCHRVLTNDSYVPPQLSLDCWHSLC
ncbi:hypothetical protein SO802_022164 [Lithocarpus litseifolius]|uniref:Uncharacterized protein n=1 Tax=Lithocarpus litseifolius TaxID=425828 RepID=A0AAW2CHB1_9ROSI